MIDLFPLVAIVLFLVFVWLGIKSAETTKNTCEHPIASLSVETGRIESMQLDEDFEAKELRCHCRKCGQQVSIGWSQTIGGVDAFLARKLGSHHAANSR